MDKPTPRREIVIENTWREDSSAHDPFCKTITMYSEDARRWIEQEAPAFGELGELTAYKMMGVLATILERQGDDAVEMRALMTPVSGKSELELHIEKCYDPAEIVAYLMDGYKEFSQRSESDSAAGAK